MSSSISSSYTHVHAPPDPRSQNGWTMIRTARDVHAAGGAASKDAPAKEDAVNGDIDVEDSVIVAEDPDGAEHAGAFTTTTKAKTDHGSIRPDVDQIVNGTSTVCFFLFLCF
jgi:hypothetical protein